MRPDHRPRRLRPLRGTPAAAALYTAAGLDPADPRHAKEIGALGELVQTALADPQNFESGLWPAAEPAVLVGTGGGSSSSPVGGWSGLPGWVIASIVSTLAVYAAGCITLIMLRRRMVSQLYGASHTGAATPHRPESTAS